MRVLNGPKTWLMHAGTQAIGLLLAVVGAGIGIWIAVTTDQVSNPRISTPPKSIHS
jgi:hypothetical protein